MSKSLELYGYFKGDLQDIEIEESFFIFLKENKLYYFGLSFFGDENFLIDLNGELFGNDLNEIELHEKFLSFCNKYDLKFIKVNKIRG